MLIISKVFNSPFVRNVAIAASGTAGAQAVLIAFSPFVTRIYGPEPLGLLGVFIAFAGLLTPIATLAYSSAIVLPPSQENANHLVWISIYICIVTTVTVGILLLLGGKQLLALTNSEAISSFMLFIPLRMFFSGCYLTTEQWLIRNNLFRIIATFAIINAIIISLVKVGTGLFIPQASTLIFISTLGLGLHAGMLYYGSTKARCSFNAPKINDFMGLFDNAKRYSDFPFYRMPQLLIRTASESLPVILVASFFGPLSAGYYALSRKVLGIPSTLIGNSIGDVFYPKITKAAQQGQNIYGLVMKATILMGCLGLIPYGLLILFGPMAFEFVFGTGWQDAGEYARWLSVWLFFFLLSVPCARVLPVIQGLKFHLFFSCVSIIVQLSSLIIGFFLYKDDIIAIALFSASGAVMYFLFVLLVLMKCKNFNLVRNTA
ncbi:MAG: oligosaccharide flippase family protein [Desulforegulaceae bacterium]|nr:oligosaccharide flippase family protein [Desulforegulaceae bacterium]